MASKTIDILRSFFQKMDGWRNERRSPQKVFSEIYRRNLWGRGDSPFYSGPGSSNGVIIEPYIKAIRKFLEVNGKKSRLVDLGCGDMRVSRNFLDSCSSFTGTDVVPELIEYLSGQFSDRGHARFVCMDIVSEELPEGDVCLLRQVLQHLSNQEILA